jgi:hypothetical protein
MAFWRRTEDLDVEGVLSALGVGFFGCVPSFCAAGTKLFLVVFSLFCLVLGGGSNLLWWPMALAPL